RQKYRNVKRDPAIALSIVDPSNPFRYLEVRGKVVDINEDQNNQFIDSMAKKYMGQDKYPFNQPGDERVIIVVEPQHTSHMG
ncbi:MAG TPA: PPOX class F420-dependent oxidoreductase, partial [Ktedonobacter sp.]|nr:PPOX class F420-dependent oxidoreductase [Ktedonobacter sp.]